DALAQVRGWREAAGRRKALRDEIRTVEREARRQAQARERAGRLGVAWDVGGGRDAVRVALDEVEAALARAEARVRDREAAAARAGRELDECRDAIRALEARSLAWRALEGRARRVAEA